MGVVFENLVDDLSVHVTFSIPSLSHNHLPGRDAWRGLIYVDTPHTTCPTVSDLTDTNDRSPYVLTVSPALCVAN